MSSAPRPGGREGQRQLHAAFVGRERGVIRAGPTRPARLLSVVRESLRVRRYSARTIETYVAWIRRYVRFCEYRHPARCGATEVRAFLGWLSTTARVSASTQNQALAALRFLYAVVIEVPLELAGDLPRARLPERLPSVLSRDEVRVLLAQMKGAPRLVAALLYGSGLRLMEGCTLRVKDVDFSRGQITIRRGKGGKDRVTMLPASVAVVLRAHLARVKRLHARDLAAGRGSVELPDALARRSAAEAKLFAWQWVFPARRCHCVDGSGEWRRHHIHATAVCQCRLRLCSSADRNCTDGRLEPSTPLWVLFVAVQILDVLSAQLMLRGVEKVRFVPQFTASNALDLYYMPHTHGLLTAIGWLRAVLRSDAPGRSTCCRARRAGRLLALGPRCARARARPPALP